MIDTIKISLKQEGVHIPSLERITTTISDFGKSIKGNYQNLIVSRLNDSVSICGSLQKFSRTEVLTHDDCKSAIRILCKTFSIDPTEARIQRIDIAKNIQTDFEPKIYYPFLGSHQRYFRSPYKNSLNYTNSLRVLTFYDKAKEQSINGNLLRYEQRYFRPESVFKHKIYLADLLTEEVYQHFLTNWKADYNKIQKIKTIIPMEHFKTPSEFFAYLIGLGADQIGNELLRNQLKIAQRSGALSKQNAKRIRDKMNRLSSTSKCFEVNSLIEELDQKINGTMYDPR